MLARPCRRFPRLAPPPPRRQRAGDHDAVLVLRPDTFTAPRAKVEETVLAVTAAAKDTNIAIMGYAPIACCCARPCCCAKEWADTVLSGLVDTVP
jgi:hypothetical protein